MATTIDPAYLDVGLSLSGGNLTVTQSLDNQWGQAFANVYLTSGKWYWEITPTHIAAANSMHGICEYYHLLSSFPGGQAGSYGYYEQNGQKYTNGSGQAYGNTWTTEVIGVALDLDNGKIFFSINGVWQNSGDPVAGTGFAFDGLSGTFVPAFGLNKNGAAATVNFGASAWNTEPPTGFSGPNHATDLLLELDESDDAYYGQSFVGVKIVPTEDWLVDRVYHERFFCNVSGNCTVSIYADDGDEPTGSPLATSEIVTDILTSDTGAPESFIFSTPYLLEANTAYWFVWHITGQQCFFYYDNTNQYPAGSIGYSTHASQPVGNWITNTTFQPSGFNVYGQEQSFFAVDDLLLGPGSVAEVAALIESTLEGYDDTKVIHYLELLRDARNKDLVVAALIIDA